MSTNVDLAKPAKATSVFTQISGGRRAKNTVATVLFGACFLVAAIPLAMVLWSVLSKGMPAILEPSWWSGSQYRILADKAGGGVGHAIVGSLIQVAIATVISVPIGVLVGILFVEYPTNVVVRPATFMVDVLAGVPSIVASIFVFGIYVIGLGMGKSSFAVSLALVLLMIPVVVRSTEEMLKLVPDELREASYALGVPKWKTIVRIVVPTALSGMISGIFLAVARVMGETAPVLVLAGMSSRFNYDPFEGNMASLPLFIKDMFSNTLTPAGHSKMWGAALTLILIVAVANILATVVSKALAPKTK